MSEALGIGELAEAAMKKTVSRPHFWCGLVHGDTSAIRKQWRKTVETIAGHEEYQKERDSMISVGGDGRVTISIENKKKLDLNHAEYLNSVEEILSSPVDGWSGSKLVITKVPESWRAQMNGCDEMTKLLTEYDLWESPQKLRDAIYTE